MSQDAELRQQLRKLHTAAQAHMRFEEAVKDFPPEHINTRPPNCEYSFWHLLEHVRICQRDALDFMRDPDHVHPEFPAGVWPARDANTDAAGWQATIDQFLADRQALMAVLHDPATDLTAPIPHSQHGHNILYEMLDIADHNTYHIGELSILRQVMGLW